MSASLRFLAVAVIAWAGVRAATLGGLPGIEAIPAAHAESGNRLPAIIPTEFPPLPPMERAAPIYSAYPQPYGDPRMAQFSAAPQIRHVVHHYAEAPPTTRLPAGSQWSLDEVSDPVFYSQITPIEDWPISRIDGPPGGRQSQALPAGMPTFVKDARLDRLQLSGWALLRGTPGEGGGLANGGSLGGSQSGARLTYAFDRRLALSLRASTPVGGARGGEVAAGVRVTPIPSIPLAITAERRQRIGDPGTGRSDFALFAEGGLYQQPIAWDFSLDAYAQAGVVGLRSRDFFADGAIAITRPFRGPVSVGFGSWAGYQPGLYRIDAGPRISMQVRRNMRIDLDWRQRIAGNADPGSGPALTLSGNF